MQYFFSTLDYAQEKTEKPFKHTFFDGFNMLAGLNVLAPGQSQPIHEHPQQDKFYLVLEGSGDFTVGGTTQHCTPYTLILAPAGVPHGVHNSRQERLVFLTTIAPGISKAAP